MNALESDPKGKTREANLEKFTTSCEACEFVPESIPNPQRAKSCNLTGLSGQRTEFEAHRAGQKLGIKF